MIADKGCCPAVDQQVRHCPIPDFRIGGPFVPAGVFGPRVAMTMDVPQRPLLSTTGLPFPSLNLTGPITSCIWPFCLSD